MVKDGAEDELLTGGGHALGTEELLALYFGDARAAEMLAGLGLDWLRGRLPAEATRELGAAAAIKLMAMRELRVRWLESAIDRRRPLRRTSELARYLDARHARLDQEVAGVVYLHEDGALAGDELLFRGFFRRIHVSIKGILGAVLRRGLNRFAFFHTHPSPSPLPSPQDYRFHRRLLDACELTGVELVENLTIGVGGAYQSLYKAENARWPEDVAPPVERTSGRERFWWASVAN